MSGVRGQVSGVRGQVSGARCQVSGARCRGSGVGDQGKARKLYDFLIYCGYLYFEAHLAKNWRKSLKYLGMRSNVVCVRILSLS